MTEQSFPPERQRYVEQEPRERRALQLEYQHGIGWVSTPRVEIPMFDGGVVLSQMKNLVEDNQVQKKEKEDEAVLIFPETLFFPETLLKKRVQPTAEGLITEVLITWLGKDEGEATWKSIEDIQLHFLETDLEDKGQC